MNEENIMLNEEIVEVADECVEASSGNGLKMAGIGLAVAGLIYGGYKLISKNKKAKKEQFATVPSEPLDSKDDVEDDE